MDYHKYSFSIRKTCLLFILSLVTELTKINTADTTPYHVLIYNYNTSQK